MARGKPIVASVEAVDASLLEALLREADQVFIKKLSKNDRDWTWNKSLHQYGPYIPAEQRDSGFFPSLRLKERDVPASAGILEVFFQTEWPQVSESKKTRLANYMSKGAETHLTGVPKEVFSNLSPASFLVIGRTSENDGDAYRCLTIDSASDEALLLADLLDLPVDFQAIVKVPARERDQVADRFLSFADEALAAWQRGDLREFGRTRATMPTPLALAEMAKRKYLDERGLEKLDPFALECPGDVVREISRVVEWKLCREHQLRCSSIAMIALVLGEEPATPFSPALILRKLIDKMQEIDALMLSASQQRKSRAGSSFEFHIEALLKDGSVPFEKQVVIESRKRPDFILPTFKYLRNQPIEQAAGLILSAKTTLRERWKQVQGEMGDSELFLATVDETIAGNAIEEMDAMGIVLVVPEKLKAPGSDAAKAAEYRGHANVLSFREFFDELRRNRMPDWSKP